MKYRNTILDPICFLMKGPRTVRELADLLGVSTGNVSQWLKKFRSYGVVYIQGRRGRQFVYAWQPTPFFHSNNLEQAVRAPVEGRE